VTPDRRIHELQYWLQQSTFPVYSAWILTLLGKYHSLAGQVERGVEMVREAVRVMEPVGASTDGCCGKSITAAP
jgi:hypothetical protein